MQRALELAARGRYTTAPNPRVGCVIARLDDNGTYQTVGEGFHDRAGGPHAEVMALRDAGEAARGATAFVSLEPCAHHGRTPPCADALIEAGIGTVVCATQDPFPEVSGDGIRRLTAAGVATHVGILEAEARWLNRGFISRQLRKRPWVIAKHAVSLDGRIATRTGDSRWISGPLSRGLVHRLRAEADAVMVGAGTLRADNPRLTPRDAALDVTPAPTTRVIVAGKEALPEHPALLDDPDPILVLCGSQMPEWPGAETVQVRDLCEGLEALAERDIGLVLVEGGSALATSLFEADFVDELVLFVAPVLIGGRDAPSFLEGIGPSRMEEARRLHPIARTPVGEDVVIHATTRTPADLGLEGTETWPSGLLGLPPPL